MTAQQTPVVGMGVTRCVGSDRYPFTVIIVVNSRKIVVLGDSYRRIDNNGLSEQQEYEYTPNSYGDEYTLTLRKNGQWVVEGEDMKKASCRWYIGERVAYKDPSF